MNDVVNKHYNTAMIYDISYLILSKAFIKLFLNEFSDCVATVSKVPTSAFLC